MTHHSIDSIWCWFFNMILGVGYIAFYFILNFTLNMYLSLPLKEFLISYVPHLCKDYVKLAIIRVCYLSKELKRKCTFRQKLLDEQCGIILIGPHLFPYLPLCKSWCKYLWVLDYSVFSLYSNKENKGRNNNCYYLFPFSWWFLTFL